MKRFKEMGLSSYEAKSYLSLLERDTLTVSEVSKIAGIPRTNAYEALEKLLAKGLCISRPGNTKKYSGSDPIILKDKFLAGVDHATESQKANLAKKENEIIERYNTVREAKLLNLSNKEKEIIEKYTATKEAKLHDLSKKEKEILEKNKATKENIGNIIEELRPQYKRSRSMGNPLEYIEIIKDPHQIHKRFMELVGKAKQEILIFTKPPYSGPKEKLEEQTEQQAEPLRQGISIRSIYELPTDEKELEWWFQDIDAAAGHGEEARVIEELPMKMAIFDEKIVMIPLEDPISTATSFTAQIVEHRALARGLKILFETLWAQARDYHVLEDYIEVLRPDKMKGRE